MRVHGCYLLGGHHGAKDASHGVARVEDKCRLSLLDVLFELDLLDKTSMMRASNLCILALKVQLRCD